MHTGKFSSSFHCYLSVCYGTAAVCRGTGHSLLLSSVCIQNLPFTFTHYNGDKQDVYKRSWSFTVQNGLRHILKKAKMALMEKKSKSRL